MPVLYRRDGDQIELRGHWARANRSRATAARPVLVDGPHGYVSASWYPDKEPAARYRPGTTLLPSCVASADLRRSCALAELVGAIGDRFEASVGRLGSSMPRVPNMARSCAPSSASVSRSNMCR